MKKKNRAFLLARTAQRRCQSHPCSRADLDHSGPCIAGCLMPTAGGGACRTYHPIACGQALWHSSKPDGNYRTSQFLSCVIPFPRQNVQRPGSSTIDKAAPLPAMPRILDVAHSGPPSLTSCEHLTGQLVLPSTNYECNACFSSRVTARRLRLKCRSG
jgi:hypothetical protein